MELLKYAPLAHPQLQICVTHFTTKTDLITRKQYEKSHYL